MIQIDQMEQILKDIDKLDKKFAKLNQDRKMLMTALQAVCPHSEFAEYTDHDYPNVYRVRYCKLCKKDLI